MLITLSFILSTLALLTSAQTTTSAAMPTSISPAQSTHILHDLESYLSSLTQQPEYTSALAAFQSALPTSVLDQIDADPSDYIQSVLTDTATPTWYNAIPTSYQNYWSSVGVAEASIISKDETGPAPTTAPGIKVVGAALALGAAGLVLM